LKYKSSRKKKEYIEVNLRGRSKNLEKDGEGIEELRENIGNSLRKEGGGRR